ncbi:hypothetical protein [Parafrigoribacterium soli]|uniref:hypothetical protein n=1 Tax=Parafrigoribacterium soli TaxID=3144663 RepID=UPI0032ED0952
MKTLTLPNAEYVTGSDIADGVLKYSLALTRRQDVDIVDVPFVGDHGAIWRVQLIVGWRMGLAVISSDERSEPGELFDVEAMGVIRAKSHALGAPQGHAFTPAELEALQRPSYEPYYA